MHITNSNVAPLFENPTSSLPAHPGDRVFLNGLRFLGEHQSEKLNYKCHRGHITWTSKQAQRQPQRVKLFLHARDCLHLVEVR